MSAKRVFALGGLVALAFLLLPASPARAGVFVGIGIPGPYYRPHYRPYYRPYYYGPRVVIAAPPVVVAPAAPVYVAPPPAPVYVAPAPAVIQTPAPPPAAPVPVAPPPGN